MIRWTLAVARSLRLAYLQLVQSRIEHVAPGHPECRLIRLDIERAHARLNATWR